MARDAVPLHVGDQETMLLFRIITCGSQPLQIKSLNLTNFRRFEEFKLDFHQHLTVLVAVNGGGKTSILDGLAICLGAFLTRLPGIKGINYRKGDFRDQPHNPPFMRLRCELASGLAWDRTELRDKSSKTRASVKQGLGLKLLHDYADSFIDAFNEGKPFDLPVILYYGAGRGAFDLPARKRGFGKVFRRFDAFHDCLESRTNFRRFVEYFYFLEDLEHRTQKEKGSFEVELPELKAIRNAVSRALPEISNPRGAYPAGIMIDWNQDTALRIEQLSDGYRTTLAMIMDIAARMVEANPHLEDPLQTGGVILIDEVDMHLHPAWQQTIIGNLQQAFPNIQFIVTTHSPQVLTTVPPECIRVFDWPKQGPPQLIPVPFSQGAEAHQLLEQILGVTPRPQNQEIVKKLIEYQRLVEDNRWDDAEALALREELDQWGAEFEPELRRLDVDIRFSALDRA